MNPAVTAAATSRARRTDARCESPRRRLEPEEVHEVRRQQDEAARVDGGDHPPQERQAEVHRHAPVLGDAVAQLVVVEGAGLLDDRPSAVDEQRDRVGDDAERVGQREPGIAQQLVGRRRGRRRSGVIVAAVSYGLTPTKRTSSPTSACDGGEVGQLAGARRARRVPQVDDHRPAVGGAQVDRRRRRRSRSVDGRQPVGGQRRVGRRARLDVLAGLGRARTVVVGAAVAGDEPAPDDGADRDHDAAASDQPRGTPAGGGGPAQPRGRGYRRPPPSRRVAGGGPGTARPPPRSASGDASPRRRARRRRARGGGASAGGRTGACSSRCGRLAAARRPRRPTAPRAPGRR